MKKPEIIHCLLIGALLFAITGCIKTNPSQGTGTTSAPGTPQPPSSTVPKNTAPIVNAGSDIILTLPTNEVSLNATCVDAENNIRGFIWEKISGPGSFNISTVNFLQPRLSNLVKGEYHFELTVFDSLGLYDKDTIELLVRNPPIIGNGSVIFEDRTWIYPWYASIEIPDFYSWIPTGSNFTIFVKRDATPDWIEVGLLNSAGSNSQYEYFIETRPDGAGMYTFGSLYIFYYGWDVDDTPDVKIVF